MKIPFVGPSGQARSRKANNQRTLNCFLELNNESPRAPVGLYGRPGKRLLATLGHAGIRAEIELGDYLYVVAANKVYRVASDWTSTLISGSLGTSTGQIGVAANATEIIIVDGTSGWLVTGTTLTEIADADFPTGVTRAIYLDGFFVVSGDGSGRAYINENPNDGSSWVGTDFASAERNPDPLLFAGKSHRTLMMFGSRTIEPWVNTGATFPFEPSPDTLIEQGTVAAGSVVAMDSTLYFLGGNENGGGIVFMLEGSAPRRVSDHDMENTLAGYSDLTDATAYCVQLEGHSFYVLNFPTADATWVYDAASERWHEWSWRDPDTNEDHRDRGNCHAYFGGEHVVGDWETGDLYALDLSVYDDNGDPIRYLRRTQTIAQDGKRQFFGILTIDMETGVGLASGQGSDPVLYMRYSDDGGRTWSDEESASIGLQGDYDCEVKFGPCGQGKDRVWEIYMTDPVQFAVFGASVDIEVED